MKDEGWAQCQTCGYLHKIKTQNTSDDDLYIKEYCPKCRDGTKHIWCGENQEDIYIYYNANLDPRIY